MMCCVEFDILISSNYPNSINLFENMAIQKLKKLDMVISSKAIPNF